MSRRFTSPFSHKARSLLTKELYVASASRSFVIRCHSSSCFPTRIARHGTVLSRSRGGRVNLKNAKYARAFGEPICRECSCSTCRNHDVAYLHHLSKAKEPLLHTLASVHNIQYMNDLMRDIREAIMRDEI